MTRTTLVLSSFLALGLVAADLAQYTRVPGLATPMGSHVVAHADASSREQDPLVSRGSPESITSVFGRLPGGRP